MKTSDKLFRIVLKTSSGISFRYHDSFESCLVYLSKFHFANNHRYTFEIEKLDDDLNLYLTYCNVNLKF